MSEFGHHELQESNNHRSTHGIMQKRIENQYDRTNMTCLMNSLIIGTHAECLESLKHIFHQCVTSYTCSLSNSDGSVLSHFIYV